MLLLFKIAVRIIPDKHSSHLYFNRSTLLQLKLYTSHIVTIVP